MLEEFLSRNVIDAVKAYCKDEIINLGFAKSIQTLEYLFCPLDLQFIEQKLMGTRKVSVLTQLIFAMKVIVGHFQMSCASEMKNLVVFMKKLTVWQSSLIYPENPHLYNCTLQI